MIELDCKLTPAPEMVVLREISESNASSGGFVLAEGTLGNSRTGFFMVEEVGSEAFNHTGLKHGDYVYADRLASHYHTSPVCVMKWDNVLLCSDANKSIIKSMPGWALLIEVKEERTGFFVSENKTIRHGIIKFINPAITADKEYPFKVGDDVMITSKCDVFDGFAEETLIAMKLEEIVAKFDKEND